MHGVAERAAREDISGSLRSSFPEWAAREVERLLKARTTSGSAAERAQLELQLAVICDAAQRYGNSLAESSELAEF
jgi:hypothetical protein